MTLVRDNKYIPSEDKDFFILLRIGLWQKVEEELSPNPDWEYIYKLATEQTVQGIITDGIGLYRKQHPDLNITQEQNERFLNITAQIIKRNYAVNQLQARICQLFDNPSRINELFPNTANETAISESALSLRSPMLSTSEYVRAGIEAPIHYVILKGQAVAQCYPKPMLRCSGDIDFLLPQADYERAQGLLLQIATKADREFTELKHIGFYINDIEVELHGTINPKLNRNVEKTLRTEQNKMFSSNMSTIFVSDTEISTPNSVFHAFYIFIHCLQHYYRQSLGLRQICDFSTIISKLKSAELAEVNNLVEQCKLFNQYRMFLLFAEKYMGLSLQQFISKSKMSTNYIWTAARKSGNMGHNSSSNDSICDIIKFIKANAIISPTLTFRFTIMAILGYFPNSIIDKIYDFRRLIFYKLGIR